MTTGSSEGWRAARRAVENLDVLGLVAVLDAHPGLDLNERGPGGWTLLHVAVDAEVDVPVQEGAGAPAEVSVSGVLLDRGADLEAVLPDGRTAVDLASQRGHESFLSRIRNG